ncbi:nicotinate phosphoribosyltransferase [Candidatus Stoquefichus massiliensis]|uniref:nicotinate phosphoribosyltransferase n=1 Tax=Candidatus Stoquefichus massiliensis TaxID=1470350 RepID=UPI000480C7DD|nr:nicotinate phosphoribosyltransferase [Candidatus Stoquefichus massiliensis]
MEEVNVSSERNITLIMDFYELTMSYNYFKMGKGEQIVYFDMFYRKNPDNGGFVIFAGLQQLIEAIQDMRFTEGDIEYLRSLNIFDEDFFDYLRNFQFTGTLYSVPEGTPVFPYEPLITVKAKLIEAQLIETFLLVTINHQSLIATKAHRVCQEAKGRAVMEFGARRAQGYDGAHYGARAAYIGGVAGTATTSAGKAFQIPVLGTMAHSFVQSFDNEFEAFKAYAEIYPDSCVLLVDTYDTLKSGVPNAIRVAEEVLAPMGKRLAGIRLDSGDIAYLTKKARMMLDVAGLHDCKITVSNSLDEYLIRSVLEQGAQIDSFGVGENMIVSKSAPVFGGVYKLAAVEKDGQIIPKIKISENTEKITNPGYKKVYRLIEKETNKAIADIISFYDEVLDENQDLTIYHQSDAWKNKTLYAGTYEIHPLQTLVFKDGQCVYPQYSLDQIREYSIKQKSLLWDEVFRLEYPHIYYVDLTKKLLDYKLNMLAEGRKSE